MKSRQAETFLEAATASFFVFFFLLFFFSFASGGVRSISRPAALAQDTAQQVAQQRQAAGEDETQTELVVRKLTVKKN